MLLREDIYATASLIGCAVFWAAQASGLNAVSALLTGAATILMIRAFAIRLDLDLPKPKR